VTTPVSAQLRVAPRHNRPVRELPDAGSTVHRLGELL
jgi:hypothetical protein